MNIIERDKKIIWHPFTQEKTSDLPIAIKKANKSYVYDYNDRPYLDLISSWWVNLHGHANPIIAKAIYKQALTLEHVIFAGFTHEPAVNLCELILKELPTNLAKCFFSDNGSTSVEVALKMVYQYWLNLGEQHRNIFLSFSGAFHGDTFGAMSVGSAGFQEHFKKLLFKSLHIPFPATYENDADVFIKEQQSIEILDGYLQNYKNQIAGIILEPLVQGANGMRMCRSSFIEKIITMVRSHHILVIFDEVMTGFGRTGSCFALDQINAAPDLICLSKGITGGFLPLALTIVTNEIYQAFLGDTFSTAFAHGHSYTANPLACAAGIASFNLLKLSSTQIAISDINQSHITGINYLKNNCNNIQNARILGTIAAFEINYNSNLFDFNKTLKSKFLQNNLLLRPLGNTVYLLPPYSISKQELLQAYDHIGEILKDFQ